MAPNEFEPFRGLPLTREQDTEIRAYIARRQANCEARDTLGFSYMLKDMLAPPGTEDGCTSPVVIAPDVPRRVD